MTERYDTLKIRKYDCRVSSLLFLSTHGDGMVAGDGRTHGGGEVAGEGHTHGGGEVAGEGHGGGEGRAERGVAGRAHRVQHARPHALQVRLLPEDVDEHEHVVHACTQSMSNMNEVFFASKRYLIFLIPTSLSNHLDLF